MFIKESVYGPVTGTVTVGGKPYAVGPRPLARVGDEPAGELAFSDFDSDRVHSPQQFFEAANELGTTFNMAYIDEKNIAYFSAGRLPKLAPETDPALPTLGTGPYDWKGWISLAEHPHVVAPANSTLLNWNNKPAPEWGAASDNWAYGPLQRVQMFNGFKAGKVTEATDAGVMNKASEEDFRATFGVADDPESARSQPEQCHSTGHQRGQAAAEVDQERRQPVRQGTAQSGCRGGDRAVFDPMEEAVLGPVLGEELLGELKSIAGIDNGPNSGGSSFGGGWYGYVLKDLRSLLGETVTEPYSRKLLRYGC